MLTLSQIQDALKDRNIAHVSRKVGISRQQLWMIANGRVNPRATTLEKISNYIEGKIQDEETERG